MLALAFSVVPIGGSRARDSGAHGPAAGRLGSNPGPAVAGHRSLREALSLVESPLPHLLSGVSESPDRINVCEGQQAMPGS